MPNKRSFFNELTYITISRNQNSVLTSPVYSNDFLMQRSFLVPFLSRLDLVNREELRNSADLRASSKREKVK